MARRPAFARSFAGRWRIVEMDTWPDDVGGEAHVVFSGDNDGEIAFVAVKGFLDVRYGARDGIATPSSPSRDSTREILSPDGDGQASEPPAASSGTSTSTKATIQASSASERDFFNGLLGLNETIAPAA